MVEMVYALKSIMYSVHGHSSAMYDYIFHLHWEVILLSFGCRQGAPRKREGALPGIKGRGRFRTEEAFYENPFPECICRNRKLVLTI